MGYWRWSARVGRRSNPTSSAGWRQATSELLVVGARIDAIQAMLVLTPMLRIDADDATLAPIDELLTTADELIAATGHEI